MLQRVFDRFAQAVALHGRIQRFQSVCCVRVARILERNPFARVFLGQRADDLAMLRSLRKTHKDGVANEVSAVALNGIHVVIWRGIHCNGGAFHAGRDNPRWWLVTRQAVACRILWHTRHGKNSRMHRHFAFRWRSCGLRLLLAPLEKIK